MKKEKDKKQTPVEPKQVQEETVQTPNPEQAEQPAEEKEATIDEWRDALETAVRQRDEYLDCYRRAQADFQNFKRRNQTARADGYQDGVCEMAESILPVIDNLERALDAAQENDPLAEGVRMTLRMLFDGLKKYGFEEVPALGETFDPELHNAVMREQTEDPGKVLEVFQKGYRVKEKIIRYAMVKVSVE